MKFSCDAKELASAAGAASKIVNGHTTIPILANVLLTAGDGEIAIRATDLEVTLERVVTADVTEQGVATAPAALFAGYLSKLPAGMVEVSGTPEQVGVKLARSNYAFHTLSPENYPPLPSQQRGMRFALDGRRLKDAVEATIFAASSEEARGAILMGTLLELQGCLLTTVATDGYRLAKWETALSEGLEEDAVVRYIVPSRALAEVARNLGGAEHIEVSVLGAVGNQLAFSGNQTTITVRLVDGEYPNYAQVIPASTDRSFVATTASLIGGLRRAELVCSDRASTVKMNVSNHRLVITASSDASGNAHEELDIEQAGDDLDIAFNAKYLIEVLTHIGTPQVAMEFTSALAPAVVRSVGEGTEMQRFYVIMPTRP